MKKIFLIFLIVIFTKSNIIAASDESKTIEEESKIAVNESSIKTYEDKITFGVFSMYPSLYLYLINVSEGGSTESIVYAPNSGVNLGFMVAYKGFSLGFSWDFNNYGEEDRYGETTYRDIHFNYYFKSIGIELYYQKYKGFFLNDPEEYNLEEGDPETIKSGLFIRSIGANFLYVFNDQYSLEAAFQQTKRQLKWEWSFLLMTSLNYYQIANNGSLIPISEASEYGDEAGYQGGRYASLTLAPGIGIIVPFYMFYFTGSIYVGAGIMNKRKKINGDNYKENGSCQKANIKFGLGFNSDKSYFGIFTLWDYIDTNGRFSDNIGANAGVSAGYIGWNAGLRF